MGISKFFKNLKQKQAKKEDAPTHWVKCEGCSALMYYKEVAAHLDTCPKCHYHFKIDAEHRIEQLCDEGSFVEFDAKLAPTDPLKFVDKKSYKSRIEDGVKKTSRPSSVISGSAKMLGLPYQLVVFNFSFMGGSLGSVEGEKIVRAIKRALANKEGLLIVATSGGARMQESTYALMQMAKTSAALNELRDARLPYISLLTNPTFGGVSASFAFLGDIIIAEPGAMIGFAGPRVIKQTIGQDLPTGFQSAEFLLEHGLIDMIVGREELKQSIFDLFVLLNEDYANQRICHS